MGALAGNGKDALQLHHKYHPDQRQDSPCHAVWLNVSGTGWNLVALTVSSILKGITFFLVCCIVLKRIVKRAGQEGEGEKA